MLLNACHLSPMGDEIVTSVSPWYVVQLHGLYAFGWTSLIAFQERLLTLCPLCTGDPIMAAVVTYQTIFKMMTRYTPQLPICISQMTSRKCGSTLI